MKKSRIPLHLTNLATEIQETKKTVEFRLKCPCGEERFFVFKSTSDKKAEPKKFHLPIMVKSAEIDERAKKVLITESTFFGISVRKTYENWDPNKKMNHRTVLKLKCPNCGKEFVLFDSAVHGYDGVCAETENSSFYPLGPEVPMNEDAWGLSIKSQYGGSYEAFTEEFGTFATRERYLNSFLSLKIHSLSESEKNGKKKIKKDVFYRYEYVPCITAILR